MEPLLTATRELAARYGHVLATRPELADRIGAVHAAHQAHAEALAGMIGRPGAATASPRAGTWSPPLDRAREPEDLFSELRDAELDGREDATAACLAAPPDRASALGSIAAARAAHAEVLG